MRGYTQTTMIGDHASPGPITFSIRSSAARVALSRISELETWLRNDLLSFGPRRLFLAKDLMSPSGIISSLKALRRSLGKKFAKSALRVCTQ